MLTLVQALDALLAGARVVPDTETVDTLAANGRVLAAPVTSTLRVPPADNTAMDGYAVRAADITAPGSGCRCRSGFRPAMWVPRWRPAPRRASLPAA